MLPRQLEAGEGVELAEELDGADRVDARVEQRRVRRRRPASRAPPSGRGPPRAAATRRAAWRRARPRARLPSSAATVGCSAWPAATAATTCGCGGGAVETAGVSCSSRWVAGRRWSGARRAPSATARGRRGWSWLKSPTAPTESMPALSSGRVHADVGRRELLQRLQDGGPPRGCHASRGMAASAVASGPLGRAAAGASCRRRRRERLLLQQLRRRRRRAAPATVGKRRLREEVRRLLPHERQHAGHDVRHLRLWRRVGTREHACTLSHALVVRHKLRGRPDLGAVGRDMSVCSAVVAVGDNLGREDGHPTPPRTR